MVLYVDSQNVYVVKVGVVMIECQKVEVEKQFVDKCCLDWIDFVNVEILVLYIDQC